VICRLDLPPKAVLIAPGSRTSKPCLIDVDFGASVDPRSRLENSPDSASGFAAQSFSQWATDDDPRWATIGGEQQQPTLEHLQHTVDREDPCVPKAVRLSEFREVSHRDYVDDCPLRCGNWPVPPMELGGEFPSSKCDWMTVGSDHIPL